ncbi:helix-turn-helix domain-containing protein [Nonomuraea sp. KC401]|uniref:AraC-like ligand-binding domain-containing protein n=1 Tax=unclassified Nonomuraea TaxID=2593643 RepID=UPI0010FDA0DF|nr:MULTISPECIES: helix-turn-helix domain-containing protein [unclassified Nonomuraea]NBF00204.1 helix-turn-helix domain-containing protein [Nonomuraea sp. K271]TLF52736.1 helix-turn-helix domain-containing protein [Nonomuraea sp. KC401]
MVIEAVSRSEDVPAPDRFEHWRELALRKHVPLEVDSDQRGDFRASRRLLQAGGALMWSMTVQQGHVLRRTPRLIQMRDPEWVYLAIPLRGTMTVQHDGLAASFGPHSLCVLDSSRPVEVRVADDRGRHVGVGLELPKRSLPLPKDGLNRLTGRQLSAREGFGALLSRFLTGVAGNSASYGPSDGPRLETVATDLVSALFAQVLERDAALPQESRRRTLLLRIRAFIQHHLRDPQLTPREIAAAHHISVSYLHRLFMDESATVAAFLHQRRLELARRELSDSALRGTPIHVIAARCGFSHAAIFSRAFRAAYGMTPRDYRQWAAQRERGAQGRSRR